MPGRPVGPARPPGDALDNFVGHSDAGRQLELGPVAGSQFCQVPGDHRTGEEVRRPDDTGELLPGHRRLANDPAEGIDDALGPERRPAALAVAVAVDEADRDGGQLAALGGQHHLAGAREADLGVPGVGRRVVPAAAQTVERLEDGDLDQPDPAAFPQCLTP
jgi:hypothetical protein